MPKIRTDASAQYSKLVQLIAVMRSMQGCKMFQAGLQPALAQYMLRNLELKDLGCLACACKGGRDLIAQGGLELWRILAEQTLPIGHPARSSAQVLTGARLIRALVCAGCRLPPSASM